MADVYEQMLKDAGIPTTQEEIEQEWKQLSDDAELKIKNDSAWSPFWRLITAITTTPALWVVRLLLNHVLPNFFLKNATGEWLVLLAWAVDVEKKEATYTQGVLTFTRKDTAGDVEIPEGFVVSSTPISGKVYRLVATETVLIPDGIISADVNFKAENAGSAYNLGPGYYSVMPEPLDFIESVSNVGDWITVAGTNEESDESLRLRCRNQFSAVGQYHHDAAYTADISKFAGISPDYIWFEHDAPRGPGSANAYIMIDSGSPAQTFVDEINNYINDQGHHGHGDSMLCYPMPTTSHLLTADVYYKEDLPAERLAFLEMEAENRIRCAFRENQDYTLERTMPFSRFSFSKLQAHLHENLEDLESVSFNLADIVSQMSIPVLSDLTINMVPIDGTA